MLSLRCHPPLSFPARRPMTSSSSRAEESSLILSALSFPFMPCMAHMRARFSFTLRAGATAVSWGETPIISFTFSDEVTTFSPNMKASPLVGRDRVDSIFMVVVLPAPLTPRRAKSSPSLIFSSRLSTAVRSLYLFVRLWVSIAYDISASAKRLFFSFLLPFTFLYSSATFFDIAWRRRKGKEGWRSKKKTP